MASAFTQWTMRTQTGWMVCSFERIAMVSAVTATLIRQSGARTIG
jgi:hypothetical protein